MGRICKLRMEMRSAYRILVRELTVVGPHRRTRHTHRSKFRVKMQKFLKQKLLLQHLEDMAVHFHP
jgi:hypothetical protein